MGVATAELSFEQLVATVHRLPADRKRMLWRTLSRELDRQIIRDFDDALQSSWAAHRGVSEDEVMADALQAVAEVRATYHASRGS